MTQVVKTIRRDYYAFGDGNQIWFLVWHDDELIPVPGSFPGLPKFKLHPVVAQELRDLD